MRRGEVYFADLEPVRGSEANKRRPVVIVSREAMNLSVTQLGEGVVTIVPLTSNVSRVLDFQVFLPALATGLPLDSKAQAEQVRALDASRLAAAPMGKLPTNLMNALDDALRLHLAL